MPPLEPHLPDPNMRTYREKTIPHTSNRLCLLATVIRHEIKNKDRVSLFVWNQPAKQFGT